MQSIPVSLLSSPPVATRIRPRTALVASADLSFRKRLSQILIGLRWQVREAEGGAQAWAEAEKAAPEAAIVDSWLPDLELGEFLRDFRKRFPQVDLVTNMVLSEVASGGASEFESPRGPYRQELLYALRRSQDSDTAAWNSAPMLPAVGAAGVELRRSRAQCRRRQSRFSRGARWGIWPRPPSACPNISPIVYRSGCRNWWATRPRCSR